MIAESKQEVIVDLLKTPVAVGTDNHALKSIHQIQRYGHQVFDLPVCRCAVARRCVFSHDPVLCENLTGKALSDCAVLRIVTEALGANQVKVAIGVVILARQQQALLRVDQLDRGLQDKLSDVGVVRQRPSGSVRAVELIAQLAVPIVFGAPRALQPLDEFPASHEVVLATRELLPQVITLSERSSALLVGRFDGGPRSSHPPTGLNQNGRDHRPSRRSRQIARASLHNRAPERRRSSVRMYCLTEGPYRRKSPFVLMTREF